MTSEVPAPALGAAGCLLCGAAALAPSARTLLRGATSRDRASSSPVLHTRAVASWPGCLFRPVVTLVTCFHTPGPSLALTLACFSRFLPFSWKLKTYVVKMGKCPCWSAQLLGCCIPLNRVQQGGRAHWLVVWSCDRTLPSSGLDVTWPEPQETGGSRLSHCLFWP